MDATAVHTYIDVKMKNVLLGILFGTSKRRFHLPRKSKAVIINEAVPHVLSLLH